MTLQCNYCGSERLQSRGVRNGKKRFQCGRCNKWSSFNTRGIERPIVPARILLFDIETLPLHVRVWQLAKNDYISPNNIILDWCALSWSAKWLYSDTVYGEALSGEDAIIHNDEKILPRMWELLNQADMVVGHNSVRFDHKKLNTRFLINNYNPPAYFKTIDTLQVVRQNFALSSNKLDFVNKTLGIHQKTDTDYDLWVKCDAGDEVAIAKMLKYNKNDVQILEELYVRLRPWMGNHPSMRSYVDKDTNICECGSTDLEYLGKPYRTNINKYQAWRCSCGKLGRSSKILRDNGE